MSSNQHDIHELMSFKGISEDIDQIIDSISDKLLSEKEFTDDLNQLESLKNDIFSTTNYQDIFIRELYVNILTKAKKSESHFITEKNLDRLMSFFKNTTVSDTAEEFTRILKKKKDVETLEDTELEQLRNARRVLKKNIDKISFSTKEKKDEFLKILKLVSEIDKDSEQNKTFIDKLTVKNEQIKAALEAEAKIKAALEAEAKAKAALDAEAKAALDAENKNSKKECVAEQKPLNANDELNDVLPLSNTPIQVEVTSTTYRATSNSSTDLTNQNAQSKSTENDALQSPNNQPNTVNEITPCSTETLKITQSDSIFYKNFQTNCKKIALSYEVEPIDIKPLESTLSTITSARIKTDPSYQEKLEKLTELIAEFNEATTTYKFMKILAAADAHRSKDWLCFWWKPHTHTYTELKKGLTTGVPEFKKYFDEYQTT